MTILESHEDDPTGYYEAINDKDFGFWKEVMKPNLESMYSNNVFLWIYSKGLIPLVINGCTRERGEWIERLRHIKPDWWQKVIVKNQVLIMRKLFHQWP